MTSIETSLELHLKDAGYSLTAPRRKVFTALQADAPLTMQQLYGRLNGQVDRTTVYRIVALFEKLRIVQRVNQGWKYRLELTDEFVPHHHHFTCLSCHKVISFDEPKSFTVMLDTVANHNGFLPTGHMLEIEGLCADCRALKV
jgi:Fur family ferric uptake transcriptional regulator